MRLSETTLNYLCDLINERIVYRSGPQLIAFFAPFFPDRHDSYGPDFGSRKDYTLKNLLELNGTAGLDACVARALAAEVFAGDVAGRNKTIADLNQRLLDDGLKIEQSGSNIVVVGTDDSDSEGRELDLATYSRTCYKEIPVEPDDEDAARINKPFNPDKIKVSKDPQAVSNVVSMIEHGEIDLRPAFQRAGNLWDAKRQSRLIESLLLKIPLPAFYFDDDSFEENGRNKCRWQVIDGLQRLCAINNFILEKDGSERQLKLTDLEFLTAFEGKTFAELPHDFQRTINTTQLTVYLVEKGTQSNVKFNIFKRVNTGGIPLTQQEIRHALHQGVASEFLKELAESQEFKSATFSRVPSARMLDREFVNRFLAFYCLKRSAFDDLESFLDSVLKDIADAPESDRIKIRDAFYESLTIAKNLFGKYAFCKLDEFPRLKPINKVLFETLTVSIARLPDAGRKILARTDPKSALDAYRKLFEDTTRDGLVSLVSNTTGSITRIEQRYNLVRSFLEELVG